MTASAFTLRQARPDDTAFLRDLYASTREDERALVPWDDAEIGRAHV